MMMGLPIPINDIYTHIMPPKYKEALFKKAEDCAYIKLSGSITPLFDLNDRFRHLNKYEGLSEVLTIGAPPIEYVTEPKDTIVLAKIANDEMAELVAKYPDFFIAAVASLPMNDMDAALQELDRAVRDLNCKGIQIYTSVNGKPLDSPDFIDLYSKMAEYDLPIWIHPARDSAVPDYPGEDKSKYMLYRTFGWPYETTLAMSRLVFSGILERFSNIKFITHHCGGMIPYFAERVARRQVSDDPDADAILTRSPIDYFRRFYGDTAMSGSTPALMCGYAFFGPDNILFGSDYPYGKGDGDERFKSTLDSVYAMEIPETEKKKIFSKNALKILKGKMP